MAYRENPFGKYSAPSAGQIGELIQSIQGVSVNMVTVTPTNITSVTLTPGVWNVSGSISFSNAAGTANTITASLNTTTATIGTIGDNAIYCNNIAGTQGSSGAIPSYRYVVASGTTVIYLVGNLTIATGTVAAGGRISATREG